MGKKKGASASDAAKVSRDWSASAICNRDINKLRALGFISASEDDIRLPGAVSRPKPPKGLILWQLTPNSILHLYIFITVCEAFLGIDPHWGLWRKIFYVKRHNDSNGPPVVRGVGFVVRKEVGYLDYPMKESVQGWRNKWFYLRDPLVPGRRSNLPPFEDKLIAKPKKSWQNTLSPEERLTADRLFDQIVILRNTEGLKMCGTEVVSVFLQRRVQPLMSRPHQLWLYTGKDDESRVSSADLSAEDLRDEVRRLTCLSMKDNIVLTSARSPYDSDHPPTETPATGRRLDPPPPLLGTAQGASVPLPADASSPTSSRPHRDDASPRLPVGQNHRPTPPDALPLPIKGAPAPLPFLTPTPLASSHHHRTPEGAQGAAQGCHSPQARRHPWLPPEKKEVLQDTGRCLPFLSHLAPPCPSLQPPNPPLAVPGRPESAAASRPAVGRRVQGETAGGLEEGGEAVEPPRDKPATLPRHPAAAVDDPPIAGEFPAAARLFSLPNAAARSCPA
ncbi:hypothetical protein QYE76_041732 [Lolium multiflorum]|uniref:Transposase (putative) gypsy type domain-containing protein n=1 Tax=Lolium multiflorum TaxID=4521 RepID=A0AAD8WUF1_LOLMU|nr:hypothetical protein QYE76_041732 [Lolium multiflorum]